MPRRSMQVKFRATGVRSCCLAINMRDGSLVFWLPARAIFYTNYTIVSTLLERPREVRVAPLETLNCETSIRGYTIAARSRWGFRFLTRCEVSQVIADRDDICTTCSHTPDNRLGNPRKALATVFRR